MQPPNDINEDLEYFNLKESGICTESSTNSFEKPDISVVKLKSQQPDTRRRGQLND